MSRAQLKCVQSLLDKVSNGAVQERDACPVPLSVRRASGVYLLRASVMPPPSAPIALEQYLLLLLSDRYIAGFVQSSR